jgi:molecular chaperone GrpE
MNPDPSLRDLDETRQDTSAETVSDTATPETAAVPPDAEIESLKDQLRRRAAEFENLKRRTREEMEHIIQYANEALLRDLLPVLDDFDRSLAAARAHNDYEAFLSGVELIQAKLLRTLEARGLKAMPVAGTPFDLDLHHAILEVPTADSAPGTVLDEAVRGYTLHGRVIRHAQVTVARTPDEA